MARKKQLPNLKAFQILVQSSEELNDGFTEELGDWIYEAILDFFEENEAPCDIRFAMMLNNTDLQLH